MANIKNIIGNKYGKLTVLELIDRNDKSKTRYLCKCECGNLHETSGDSLRGGKSKSCGCLKKAYIPKTFNKNRKQQILIQLYKSTIEKRSKMKGWLEYVSFELFTEMSMSNCYYCDIEPISKIFDRKKNKDKTLISDEFVFVNGIDRINSNIGYVKENVVSCCKHCNTTKNTMNDSEFKEWIKRVYDHYVK